MKQQSEHECIQYPLQKQSSDSFCSIEMKLSLWGSANLGSDDWWKQVILLGTPLVNAVSFNKVQLTFLWRDSQGCEQTSDIFAVYIDLNGITDHHKIPPQSLTRVIGTDIWYWQVEVEANWRGSYTLIPVTQFQLPDLNEKNKDIKRRQWWRMVMKLAKPDPFNLLSPRHGNWGRLFSAVHLANAPQQIAWRELDEGVAPYADMSRLIELNWESNQLGNQRKVWIYSTGVSDELSQLSRSQFNEPSSNSLNDRPLTILLDGNVWVYDLPIFAALDNQTHQGVFKPGVYVLIDSIDGANREQDMSCNRNFWEAVQSELLPLIEDIAPHTSKPEKTIVAGQSLGGLSAMFAGLYWPERFACVLSQSGSFWWPKYELLKSPSEYKPVNLNEAKGWLAEQVETELNIPRPIHIFMEVGTYEDIMLDVNLSLYRELVAVGHQVEYRRYCGGHDKICWRGGLVEGLAYFHQNF